MFGPDLVAEVKRYAAENYESGGWDVIVECWDDAQIAELVAGCATVEEAIARFEPLVDVWADRQADARNSAF